MHKYKILGIIIISLLLLSIKCSNKKLCEECSCYDEKVVSEKVNQIARYYHGKSDLLGESGKDFDRFVKSYESERSDTFYIIT